MLECRGNVGGCRGCGIYGAYGVFYVLSCCSEVPLGEYMWV